MRQNQNSRRSRGRTGSNGGSGGSGGSGRSQNGRPVSDNRQPNRKNFSSPNRQYDSQGPDGKNRGTASQLCERYKTLSREAIATDRTLAEAFSQFADHYYRLAAEAAELEGEAERGRDTFNSGEQARDGVAHQVDRPQGQSVNGNSSVNGNVALEGENAFSPAEAEPAAEDNRQRPAHKDIIPAAAQSDEAFGDEGSKGGPRDGAREGSRSPWGMSRRRRGQNYRDARQNSDENGVSSTPSEAAPVSTSPSVAAPVVDAVPVKAMPANEGPVSQGLVSEGTASRGPASRGPASEDRGAAVEVVVARRRRVVNPAVVKESAKAEVLSAPELPIPAPEVKVKARAAAKIAPEAAPEVVAEAKPAARRGRPRKIVATEEPAL